jgi:hypothetical protein
MFLVMFFVFMYALGTLNLLLGKHQFAFNAILELNAITVPSALGSLLFTGALFRAFLFTS